MKLLTFSIVAALHPARAFCSMRPSSPLAHRHLPMSTSATTSPHRLSTPTEPRSRHSSTPMASRQTGLHSMSSHASIVATTLRGGSGFVDNSEFVGLAYDWAVNLGAPAALVAGAVVATLYENVRGGALEIQKTDSKYARLAKQLTTFLLVTSFALQIVSIFVTTVTGTMLLSREAVASKTVATSALGYLRDNFEFEYLTSRLSFLQGLLNWLGAVAVEHTIPRPDESPYSRKVNRFIASSLITLIMLIMSFYNAHMTFYSNYCQMVVRWFAVSSKRFFGHWPPRPMFFVYVPSMIVTFVLGIRALREEKEDVKTKSRSQ